MKITRISTLSGILHTREIDVTSEQIQAWANGKNIQEAMPLVPAAEREFILSGITPEEWDECFADDDHDQGPQ